MRWVFFDVDDTLYDHRYAAREALRALQGRHPELARRPLGDLEGEYDRLLSLYFPRVLSGELTHEAARAMRVKALFAWAGRKLTARDVPALIEELRTAYRANHRAVPGAAELLEELGRGCRIAAISNGLVADQQAKLDAVGLGRLVPVTITSEEAGATKPDPEIFQFAFSKLGAEPQASVMVGDSWTTDVLGSRAAGIAAVWFNARALPNPDPSLALELSSFEPTSSAADLIRSAVRMEEE